MRASFVSEAMTNVIVDDLTLALDISTIHDLNTENNIETIRASKSVTDRHLTLIIPRINSDGDEEKFILLRPIHQILFIVNHTM